METYILTFIIGIKSLPNKSGRQYPKFIVWIYHIITESKNTLECVIMDLFRHQVSPESSMVQHLFIFFNTV